MIIYVVTIGSGIDDTVKLLGMEGEMFDSYVLNAIGAASAEMIAEDLNYYFNDTISNGKTELQYYRFSPGYGDWLVNDQKILFSLLKPEERIGVILNDGYIMLPEKSTSGIMGLKSNTQKPILHSGNE
jgi:cobalamin-dependent methionine synthase I